MADNQQRINAMASQFGEPEKINIFLGPVKVYPGKELSDQAVKRIENALRSPELEKGTLRVLEDKALIYRSSQGTVDIDTKGVANLLHHQAAPSISAQANGTVASRHSPEAQQAQTKQLIPLNPSPQQLDQKMPQLLNSTDMTKPASTDAALATAQARIDSLQSQLDEAKKSIQDLSKFVHERGLKHWAQTKAQEIGKTSQSVAEQAKTKMLQWMQSKACQVKEAVHLTVDEVKTAAQGKIDEVRTLAQEKASGIKTVAQGKINDVKTSVQDKVTEVKTAAELKAIEVKEAARSQVNQFLAPINTEKVERSAKHLIQAYGDGTSYNKAATHAYSMNQKGEVSIARQSDQAVVFQKGEVTKAATSDDILKLNALPSQLGQIKAAQLQTTQKQEMEVG